MRAESAGVAATGPGVGASLRCFLRFCGRDSPPHVHSFESDVPAASCRVNRCRYPCWRAESEFRSAFFFFRASLKCVRHPAGEPKTSRAGKFVSIDIHVQERADKSGNDEPGFATQEKQVRTWACAIRTTWTGRTTGVLFEEAVSFRRTEKEQGSLCQQRERRRSTRRDARLPNLRRKQSTKYLKT